MNIIMKIGAFLHQHFEEFTTPVVVILAIFGLACAIVGHYGQMGFDWRWFLLFELPLYLFCMWALWSALKMYKEAKKLMDKKKENC